jgi:hypothetical protein
MSSSTTRNVETVSATTCVADSSRPARRFSGEAVMDSGGLPPEINSERMYSGTGPTSSQQDDR